MGEQNSRRFSDEGGGVGERLAEHDSVRGYPEFADLGVVVAGACLQHGDGAPDGRSFADVLEENDVVGEVGDAVVEEAVDLEEIGQLARHEDADALPREALDEGVDELAKAGG